MSRRAVMRIAIGIVLASVGLSVLALVALVVLAVVSAANTQVVQVRIEGAVHSRDTGQPVPGCLLSFVEGRIGTYPNDDSDRSNTRTDPAGRGIYSTFYSHGGLSLPYARRDPKMRIYIGEAPRYGGRDDVETWEITLRFREPLFSGSEVTPRIEVRRFMGNGISAVLDPLPAGPGDAKVEARVYVSKEGDGPLYRIPLDIYLNPAQIAACRAPARP